MNFEVLLFLALILDLLIGDPKWMPHPVRGIGKIAEKSEYLFRKLFLSDQAAGILTFFTTLTFSVFSVFLLLEIALSISYYLHIFLALAIIYFFVAFKDLLVHSNQVYTALTVETSLVEARAAVAQIVGRDTQSMDEQEICRATVETVAENMVDGITAPLFWGVIFSLISVFSGVEPFFLAALGITGYKAINTMDSMFGYINEKYQHFGYISAKVDDFVNFIPARISGLCVVLAAFLLGKDGRRSLQIFLRDRRNHASPNSAHTEAAVAGALGVELGGSANYFGKTVAKPVLGDSLHSLAPLHIREANALIFASSWLFIFSLCLFRIIFVFLV